MNDESAVRTKKVCTPLLNVGSRNMPAAKTDSSSRHRVLIVDDHPMFRLGLKEWLQKQPELELCAEADNQHTLRQSIAAYNPDLVLLDLRLQGGDGIELIKSLCAEFPAIRILVLSQSDEGLYGDRALRAGARGYIMKVQSPEELKSAIRVVLQDDVYTSEALSAQILKRTFQGYTKTGISSMLSDRELQVFELLGVGMGTREVAVKLGLGIKTIETHREKIKLKLGLKDAAGLIHAAICWMQEQNRGS